MSDKLEEETSKINETKIPVGEYIVIEDGEHGPNMYGISGTFRRKSLYGSTWEDHWEKISPENIVEDTEANRKLYPNADILGEHLILEN